MRSNFMCPPTGKGDSAKGRSADCQPYIKGNQKSHRRVHTDWMRQLLRRRVRCRLIRHCSKPSICMRHRS